MTIQRDLSTLIVHSHSFNCSCKFAMALIAQLPSIKKNLLDMNDSRTSSIVQERNEYGVRQFKARAVTTSRKIRGKSYACTCTRLRCTPPGTRSGNYPRCWYNLHAHHSCARPCCTRPAPRNCTCWHVENPASTRTCTILWCWHTWCSCSSGGRSRSPCAGTRLYLERETRSCRCGDGKSNERSSVRRIFKIKLVFLESKLTLNSTCICSNISRKFYHLNKCLETSSSLRIELSMSGAHWTL